MAEPARESCFANEARTERLVVREMRGQHLHRDMPSELLVTREVHGRHAAVAELSLEHIPACGERLDQSPSPCFLCSPCFSPCFPWPCSSAGGRGPGAGAGGTQCTLATSSLTAAESCSCSPAATCPRLIAAIVRCCSCRASVSARHESPAASAEATASLWPASEDASERVNVGSGGGAVFPAPPHALRLSAAARAAASSRRLVRVFLRRKLQGSLTHGFEVPLLNRDTPFDQLLHAAVARALVQRLQDLPVAHLAGLGHGQELEAVERVGRPVEVVLHHLGRLLLDLARLIEDRRLLALEAARDLRRTL